MTGTPRYPLNVFWSDEDEGYVAVARDLPGCSAFGSTQAEAIAEAQDAIVSWIDAARSAGNYVPEPSRPAEREDYSGKVLVRMPKALHARLARDSQNEGVSLNHYIVYILSSGYSPMRQVSFGVVNYCNLSPNVLNTSLGPPQTILTGYFGGGATITAGASVGQAIGFDTLVKLDFSSRGASDHQAAITGGPGAIGPMRGEIHRSVA